MGQGYSNTIRDGDSYFDRGQLDEAETQYLIMQAQKRPEGASDDTLMSYASCKLQASMNLGVIYMMRGQTSQAEKYLGEAVQLEVKHSDSERRHHVNTLAVLYLASMSCLSPKPESEHLLQRIMTSRFVSRALETRLEHANLVACVHAFLLFRLDRPLPIVLAPLLRFEPFASRIVYNQPDSTMATTHFEVDGELEGVELDQEDDDIGDVPSDDDTDLVSDETPERSSKGSSTTSSGGGSMSQSSEGENRPNYFVTKATRPSPFLELVRAIVLTHDPLIDPEQTQALAQAARARAIEQIRTVYAGAPPSLFSLWRNRGLALQRLERHAAASVAFMLALACHWTSVEAWVELARSYSNAGRDEDARNHLAILTDTIAPNLPDGWLERSRICMKSGKFAEAAMCCDRITLDIDPSNIEAWARRAFATLQLRRWNSRAILETLQLTDSALNLNAFHVPTLRTKAAALVEHGRYSEAHDAVDVILTQAPNDAEAIHTKATAFRHMHRYEEAILWYKRALNANPHSADVALHLAICYFQMATASAYRPTVSSSSTLETNNSAASPSNGDAGLSNTISGPKSAPIPVNAASTSASSDGLSRSPSNSNQTSDLNSKIVSAPSFSGPSLRSSSNQLPGNGVNSSALANSMTCDPSLMPDGTFVGTLPFNQAEASEYPTMITVMAHLRGEARMSDVVNGLEATELALDISTRYPVHDGPEHFYFEPSSLPRMPNERYGDETLDLVRAQNQFVKSQIWATRALLLAHARRLSEALTAIDHAIEESSHYLTLAYIAKGDVLALSHKPAEDVFAAYRKALEHDPDSEYALLSIIHLLLSQGESKEAFKFTTRLSKLANDGFLLNPRLAIEIHASTLFHLAQYDQAFKYCLEHLPTKNEGPKISPRSMATSSASEPSNSPEQSSESEEDVYHVRLLNIAAQSLHQLGKCDEAQSYFDRSLRPDPLNVYTWNEKARCLLQNKRFDDALHYFDRALVLDPNDIRTICNRALCICLLGNIEEGTATLLQMEKGQRHKEASEWLTSLSPSERAYHFDSLTAARELQKRRDNEASVSRSEERTEEM
jgi:tetratricopeptide (TPR) repeat protein